MRSPRAARVVAGVTAAYVTIFVAGLGSVLFAPEGSHVASWWPAAGVAVALLALARREWWPWLALGVAVVSGLANLAGGRDLDLSACFGLANGAEAWVAAALLCGRSGGVPRLISLEDLWHLLVATAAGATVLGTGAALAVWITDNGDPFDAARSTLPSHAAAILVIVPVALLWPLGTQRAPWLEYVVQTAALAATTLLVFAPEQQTQIAFATLPLLVWGALRLDARTVSIEALAVSVAAVVLTSKSRGPFGAALQDDRLSPAGSGALLQSFLLAAVALTLPLVVEVEERRRLLAALRSREELFRRNFTASMTGMLLLRRRGDRLEITDANERARDLLEDGRRPLVGQVLDRVLLHSEQMRAATRRVASGRLDGWRGQLPVAARPERLVDVALAQLSQGDDETFSAQLLDITELHQARARSEAAERLTRATLDTTASIIFLTDLEGTVLRCNAATLRLTGWTEEQLVGQPAWTHLVPERRVHQVQTMFTDEGLAAFPWQGEGPLLTAGGATLRVLWSVGLVLDDDGVPTHAVMTGTDVTSERVTSGQLRLLLEAGITTAIVGVDSSGAITLVNSGAEAMIGRTADEVRGTPFVDLLDPDQLADRTRGVEADHAFGALTASLTGGGESQVSDWTWIDADGARHIVSMSISGGGSELGRQMGFLVIARDVTEQRENQLLLMSALEKERAAVEQLRALDTAKDEFVSTVSHELRTPVTSIVGYTELLQDLGPDAMQQRLLDAIVRNSERLVTLCDDLLTLGAQESGADIWEHGTVDLRDLLRGVEDTLRPVCSKRDLHVECSYPDEPLVVAGEPRQLERVLANLMSNAVKFTPDGGRVTARLESREGEAWLEVEDTGIGIPEEEQDRLFEKFFRSSTSQRMAIQGSGLGLAIVSGIVGAHGGRISASSTAGEGSTFTVRLPLAAEHSLVAGS